MQHKSKSCEAREKKETALFLTSFKRNGGCTNFGFCVKFSSNCFWYFDRAKK